jgi:hypothetical protein
VITTPSIDMTFVQAARLLAEHLTDHALPEPVSLEVISKAQRSRITAQVSPLTLSEVAAELLAWADTLTTVTVQAWRPPTGHRVHLSMTSTLGGATGPVELTVFGGTDHDPAAVGELTPDEHRAVTLGELRTWATNASDDNREGATR